MLSSALAGHATKISVAEGAPCWPHALVQLTFEKLRAQTVLTKPRNLRRFDLQQIGPQRQVEEGNFGWEIGGRKLESFEVGLKSWFKVAEQQRCQLTDLIDTQSRKHKVGRQEGLSLMKADLRRETTRENGEQPV